MEHIEVHVALFQVFVQGYVFLEGGEVVLVGEVGDPYVGGEHYHVCAVEAEGVADVERDVVGVGQAAVGLGHVAAHGVYAEAKLHIDVAQCGGEAERGVVAVAVELLDEGDGHFGVAVERSPEEAVAEVE